jgi:hypothetical protein
MAEATEARRPLQNRLGSLSASSHDIQATGHGRVEAHSLSIAVLPNPAGAETTATWYVG